MFRLAVVTCLVLGTALAKPPPNDSLNSKPLDVEPVPFLVEPVPYQDGPQPIPFQEGARATYTLQTGRYVVRSPNYPSMYPNNFDVSLTVVGDSAQDITTTCDPFSMEDHDTCAYDFLSINEVKYCGTDAPPTTTVLELRMRIKADRYVRDKGFSCSIIVAPGTTTTTAAPGPTTTTAAPSGDCPCGLRQNTRVVGGTDATAGQFPWQAGLVNPGDTRTWCGGSLINSRYVLTAAHCTAGKTAGQIQVLLGVLNIDSTDAGEQRFSLEAIKNYPGYTSATFGGLDFSLLKLDREAAFSSTISPVCLPPAGETYAGVTAIASGYGRVGANQPQATVLQHVQVPVWAQSTCETKWSIYSNVRITSTMICAGGYDEGGRSVCNGDSGGPLVTEVSGRFRLIGVVSFGRPCADAGWPDVYARVTEALSWIASSTADANTCSP